MTPPESPTPLSLVCALNLHGYSCVYNEKKENALISLM